MKRVFLTARGDADILGKVMKRDDILELESHTGFENYYIAAIDKTSFMLDLIKKSGVFAINFSSVKEAEKTKVDGKYFDKFEKLSIPKKDAEKINCPIIGGADAFECEVERIIEMGEKALIVGNVLKKHKI